jgi:hypothetical protein
MNQPTTINHHHLSYYLSSTLIMACQELSLANSRYTTIGMEALQDDSRDMMKELPPPICWLKPSKSLQDSWLRMGSTPSTTPWSKNESCPGNRSWLMGKLLAFKRNDENCWIGSKRFIQTERRKGVVS